MKCANKLLLTEQIVDQCKNKVFLTIDVGGFLMDFLSDRFPCTQNVACFRKHQFQISYLHMHLKDRIFNEKYKTIESKEHQFEK
jgi:hypothetical protein